MLKNIVPVKAQYPHRETFSAKQPTPGKFSFEYSLKEKKIQTFIIACGRVRMRKSAYLYA